MSSPAANSLTRCEPRAQNYNGARESLATRGAAYEDTLTSLHRFVTAAALRAAEEALGSPRRLAIGQYEPREWGTSGGAIRDYYRAACAACQRYVVESDNNIR